MFHPDKFFAEPEYAELDLRELAAAFDRWQRAKARPVKAPSRRKYQYSLDALFRHMQADGTPLTLRHLHPAAVESWMADYRTRGKSEHGLASALASIKVFANGFVYKQRELTVGDPLRKVSRFQAPDKEMPVYTEAELAQILGSFDGSFEGVRNRAFIAVLAATGLRLRECRELKVGDYDPVQAELTVTGKGERVRYAALSDVCHRYLKAYLKLRPKQTSADLWLTRDGSPLTEGAWVSMLRRLKAQSGVPRVRAHLFRHTFGSFAIERGAERAAVQDMLGHETDYMTRRYTRAARKRTASAMMPRYSPV